MKIDILMATYNGENYIKSQIFSLLSQSYKNWRLIIHDDGSNDRTVEIIKYFESIDSRIFFIDDGVKCGGAAANFMHLLNHYSSSDFIIFCDQDDIWLENKLEMMLSYFSDDPFPQGVFSNGYLYAENKGILGTIPSPVLHDFEQAFFIAGGLQGCSFMFNKKVVELAKLYDRDLVMHDFLITLIVITFGKLIYIDNKLMLYRQGHIGKTTSNVNLSSLSVLKNKYPVIDEKHFNSLNNFVEIFYSKLSFYQRRKYSEFQKIYSSKSIFFKIYIILKNRFSLGGSVLKLVLKVIVRPFK